MKDHKEQVKPKSKRNIDLFGLLSAVGSLVALNASLAYTVYDLLDLGRAKEDLIVGVIAVIINAHIFHYIWKTK